MSGGLDPTSDNVDSIFDAIYEAKQGEIAKLVNGSFSDKEICREVVQEIWIALYVALGKKKIDKIEYYLGKIARNKISDMIKILQKERKRLLQFSTPEVAETPTAGPQSGVEEIWQVYQAALGKLPPALELAWRLRADATDLARISDLAGISITDLANLTSSSNGHVMFRSENAARIMQISIDQYERRLGKARNILRDSLGEKLKSWLNRS